MQLTLHETKQARKSPLVVIRGKDGYYVNIWVRKGEHCLRWSTFESYLRISSHFDITLDNRDTYLEV